MKPKKREEKRSPLAKSNGATHQTGDGSSHGTEGFLRQFDDDSIGN